jgi:hypothetical protein
MVFNSKISPEDEPKINEPTMYFRVIKTKEEVYGTHIKNISRHHHTFIHAQKELVGAASRDSVENVVERALDVVEASD